MNATKLFIVTLTQEIIVAAQTPQEAEELALKENPNDFGPASISASHMHFFPADWDGRSIPYGFRDPQDPDRTVGQWIALGAAPEYTKTLKALALKALKDRIE